MFLLYFAIYHSIIQLSFKFDRNKDENAHRYAVRGEKIEEGERERERERMREIINKLN